tara:strand:+ start:242 stop:541 length:300 start_codon:yes stop_codon:yes gene_type:complete
MNRDHIEQEPKCLGRRTGIGNKNTYHFYVYFMNNGVASQGKYFRTSKEIREIYGIPKASVYHIINKTQSENSKWKSWHISRGKWNVYETRLINYQNNVC